MNRTQTSNGPQHDDIADVFALGPRELFTDLYELTMLQAYFEEQMLEPATFSLFVRRLPARRNFLLACWLAPHRRPREQEC